MQVHLQGMIPIAGGIYVSLLAYRVIEPKWKNQAAGDLWHRKYGTLMQVIGPFLAAFGLFELFGLIG